MSLLSIRDLAAGYGAAQVLFGIDLDIGDEAMLSFVAAGMGSRSRHALEVVPALTSPRAGR